MEETGTTEEAPAKKVWKKRTCVKLRVNSRGIEILPPGWAVVLKEARERRDWRMATHAKRELLSALGLTEEDLDLSEAQIGV